MGKGGQLRNKLRLRPVEVPVVPPEAGGHEVVHQVDLSPIAPVGVAEHPQDIGGVVVGAGADVVEQEPSPPPLVDHLLGERGRVRNLSAAQLVFADLEVFGARRLERRPVFEFPGGELTGVSAHRLPLVDGLQQKLVQQGALALAPLARPDGQLPHDGPARGPVQVGDAEEHLVQFGHVRRAYVRQVQEAVGWDLHRLQEHPLHRPQSAGGPEIPHGVAPAEALVLHGQQDDIGQALAQLPHHDRPLLRVPADYQHVAKLEEKPLVAAQCLPTRRRPQASGVDLDGQHVLRVSAEPEPGGQFRVQIAGVVEQHIAELRGVIRHIVLAPFSFGPVRLSAGKCPSNCWSRTAPGSGALLPANCLTGGSAG